MKYLLTCALLISGAFFSMSGHTQQNQCPDGGTYYEGYGCGVPVEENEQILARCKGYNNQYYKASWPSAATQALDSFTRTIVDGGRTFSYSANGSPPAQIAHFNYQEVYTCSGSCSGGGSTTWTMQCNAINETVKECPEGFPSGPVDVDGAEICFKSQEPCDCSELQGSGTLPNSSFTANQGVYSSANPPQCVNVTDPDTGQQCACQLVAKKWLETGSGATSTWSPLPYEQGKPSGTYTGAACGDDDASQAPPEKEECFTLKSGQKWCFANPDEKCTVVNGQEQCSSGCGYVNGDFVCYEENDPVIPDRPNEEMEEVDDTITDPGKTMPDINKGDLKEIQGGTEQRLDNVITGVNNNTNELQNIGYKIDETNDSLEGIGQQLDGQGKTLKGIKDGIDGLGDAFGDDGEPDGAGEGITGSWYESAYPDGIVGIWQEHSAALQQTPMFDFLNQFQLSPSGTQPDFNMCFNLGALGDYGCTSFEIPSIIWAFIKICILITAAFTCRNIIW